MRRRLTLLALCAIVAPVALHAQDDGHDALRAGKYQEAIAKLSKVPPTDS